MLCKAKTSSRTNKNYSIKKLIKIKEEEIILKSQQTVSTETVKGSFVGFYQELCY